MIGRVIPENANARHLLIERPHVVHLGFQFFISQLNHSRQMKPLAQISHSSPKIPLSKGQSPGRIPIQEPPLRANGYDLYVQFVIMQSYEKEMTCLSFGGTII